MFLCDFDVLRRSCSSDFSGSSELQTEAFFVLINLRLMNYRGKMTWSQVPDGCVAFSVRYIQPHLNILVKYHQKAVLARNPMSYRAYLWTSKEGRCHCKFATSIFYNSFGDSALGSSVLIIASLPFWPVYTEPEPMSPGGSTTSSTVILMSTRLVVVNVYR